MRCSRLLGGRERWSLNISAPMHVPWPPATPKEALFGGGNMKKHPNPHVGAISQKFYFCAEQAKRNKTIKFISLRGSPA